MQNQSLGRVSLSISKLREWREVLTRAENFCVPIQGASKTAFWQSRSCMLPQTRATDVTPTALQRKVKQTSPPRVFLPGYLRLSYSATHTSSDLPHFESSLSLFRTQTTESSSILLDPLWFATLCNIRRI